MNFDTRLAANENKKPSSDYLLKSKFLWVVLFIFSALGFFYSWEYFAESFPIMRADLSMSRAAALETATARANALHLAPEKAKSAVRFSQSSDVQNFIELEGGGKDAYRAMIADDVYQGLQWEVRLFAEKVADNVTLFFTPQGKSYGFTRTIPEYRPGPALSAEDARKIALDSAARDWGVDLSDAQTLYQPVEQSFETRPNGRVDHVFSYERSDQRLGKNGEGRVRITLVVRGDQLTSLHHWVRIPDAFNRRYTEMRSANQTLSTADTVLFTVLYGLGGCVVGLLLLKREHYVIIRPAIKWALIVVALQLAATINGLPGSWFGYDTALTFSTHIVQQLSGALIVTLLEALVLSVSFMTAESYSRKAFPHHPKFWELWTVGIGNSGGILGRTVGGYLWVGIDLGFVTLFTMLTAKYWGWWTPTETLADPNILGTPLPFLTPIANALHAGLWEECLFRAVPLAGAALIGSYVEQRYRGRLGNRKLWIIVGLVLQAVIFGCAHANYPEEPFYSRPVELFLPALVWGLVYLRFGLLSGVLFHFLFDLLLMSLPLFATALPGLGIDRAVVLLAAAGPLLAIVWLRWRAGAWVPLPPQALNAAWHPVAPEADRESASRVSYPTGKSSKRMTITLTAIAVAGIVLIVLFGFRKPDTLPLYLDRATAEQAADAALRKKGFDPAADGWSRFSVVEQNRKQEDDFVWQESGKNVFEELRGHYLIPVGWRVRYVRFTGDVADRAEEWSVLVENGVDGTARAANTPFIRAVSHSLPDGRVGGALSEEDAWKVARQFLADRLGPRADGLRQISADATQRPNRKDWRLEFADDQVKDLKSGEARNFVTLAGDEVAVFGWYIHIPEEWKRTERDRLSTFNIAKVIVAVPLLILLLAVFISGLIQATKGLINKPIFFGTALGLLLLSVMSNLDDWPSQAIGLSTAEPLANQLWSQGALIFLGVAFKALALGLFAGLATHAGARPKLGGTPLRQLVGPMAAVLVAYAGLALALPIDGPFLWLDVTLLSSASPLLAKILAGLSDGLTDVILASYLLIRLQDYSQNFTVQRPQTIVFLAVFGFATALSAHDLSQLLVLGGVHSLVLIGLYILVFRNQPKLYLIAGIALTDKIQAVFWQPVPHAALYSLTYLLAVALIVFWWSRQFEEKRSEETA